MLVIDGGAVKIGIDVDEPNVLMDSLMSSFPRRYIPDYRITWNGSVDAIVKWVLVDKGFNVLGLELSDKLDRYFISSPPPKPYTSESPVFFLLQVLTRSFTKKGFIVFTDTASIRVNGKTLLLMGYQHSGKSTLTALSLYKGYIPLSTENTVVEFNGDVMRVVSGTPILVYDPRIEGLYGVKLPCDEETRHGYRIVDLDKHVPKRREVLKEKPIVDHIYLLHCSYSSMGPDIEPIRGRKIKKTLWYFATSLIKGVDYYEPHPLNLMDEHVEEKLGYMIDRIGETYGERVSEVYGRHDLVLNKIIA